MTASAVTEDVIDAMSCKYNGSSNYVKNEMEFYVSDGTCMKKCTTGATQQGHRIQIGTPKTCSGYLTSALALIQMGPH